jgi:hypothetical protein
MRELYRPFRHYNPTDDTLSYARVTRIQPNSVYSGVRCFAHSFPTHLVQGNIVDFCHRSHIQNKGVLYFGDHISTDLAVSEWDSVRIFF